MTTISGCSVSQSMMLDDQRCSHRCHYRPLPSEIWLCFSLISAIFVWRGARRLPTVPRSASDWQRSSDAHDVDDHGPFAGRIACNLPLPGTVFPRSILGVGKRHLVTAKQRENRRRRRMQWWQWWSTNDGTHPTGWSTLRLPLAVGWTTMSLFVGLCFEFWLGLSVCVCVLSGCLAHTMFVLTPVPCRCIFSRATRLLFLH